MRAKTDENLPRFVAERLQAAGHDVLSVADQQLGGATDTRLATVCHDEGRILVTLDLDFADIRQYPPGSGPGLVVMRPKSQDRADIETAVALLVGALERESVGGSLWIVEQARIRVRDPGPDMSAGGAAPSGD